LQNLLLDPALHRRPRFERERAGFNCFDPAFNLGIPTGFGV
jgi:hypothetical protein